MQEQIQEPLWKQTGQDEQIKSYGQEQSHLFSPQSLFRVMGCMGGGSNEKSTSSELKAISKVTEQGIGSE